MGPYATPMASVLRKLGILGKKYTYKVDDDIIGHNIEQLKQYIETSRIKYTISISGSRVIITLSPNSMSAINANKLFINWPQDALPSKREKLVTTSTFTGVDKPVELLHKHSTKLSFGEKGVEISKAINGINFSSAIGEASQKQARKYFIIIEFSEELPRDAFIDDKHVEFINTITGMLVKKERVVFPYSEPPILPPITPCKTEFEIWKENTPELVTTKDTKGNIVVHPRTYIINRDILFPRGAQLIIEAGTTIKLGEGKSLIAQNGLIVAGTEDKPVRIMSIDSKKPFGSIGVLGDIKSVSKIHNLHISNGSESIINGSYFSGALSIHHNNSVEMEGCLISKSKADDGVNIKYSDVSIINCRFIDNSADSVDLDSCSGVIRNSQFSNSKETSDTNGDGLDISLSSAIISRNAFLGFKDKGIRIGENSRALIHSSTFTSNDTAVAVKDMSKVFFFENNFKDNNLDLNIFQKKEIFGGASAYFDTHKVINDKLKYQLDKKSSIGTYDPTTDMDNLITTSPHSVQESLQQISIIENKDAK